MFRGQLNSKDIYVLDLIQEPSGVRFLRPRLQSQPREIFAIFTSRPHTGADLMLWRSENSIAENVQLADGSRLILDAHGAWLTQEEFRAFMQDHALHSEC